MPVALVSPGAVSTHAIGHNPCGTDGSPGPGGHGMKITGTGGNVGVNNVSSVTHNSDSGNTYTNSNVNKNNTSTVNSNINRGGDTVTNDHSVKFGEGVNFSGASGVNFSSTSTNNMGRSS